MVYLLYNPLTQNGEGEKMKNQAKIDLKDSFPRFEEINVLELQVEEFLKRLQPEDTLILVGGDGTLNHFANYAYEKKIDIPMFLYKAGTSNDFLRDIEAKEKLVPILPYLQKLPKVTINGQSRYFINGIGYGIDGMVCEIADEMKAKGIKNINYTAISIKLLLGKYKCANAIVFVDGREYHYKKVWIASAMFGRYYGGGMMVAPTQNRTSGRLSFVVMHKSGKLRTLMTFSAIFKGGHLKRKKYCSLMEGNRIDVRFDKPMALQIDGEVVKNVTSYVAEL